MKPEKIKQRLKPSLSVHVSDALTNIQQKRETMNIAIIMCSYNEEKTIETALKSIVSQSYFKKNRSRIRLYLADSFSKDRTRKIAKKYVDEVILCPRGKLTSRDKAIRQVDADIIISVDADNKYTNSWLEELINALHKKNVVAVSGHEILNKKNKNLKRIYKNKEEAYGLLLYLGMKIAESILNFPANFGLSGIRLNGGNSAFYKKAYKKIGGFNIKINQRNWINLWLEEEINFGLKLGKIGRVVKSRKAKHYPLRFQKISHYLFNNPKLLIKLKDMQSSFRINKKILHNLIS